MKREKFEIIYSVGVLIAIPILVVANTLLLVRYSQNAFNNELRRKADVVNSVISEMSKEDIKFQNFVDLESKLKSIEQIQPTIVATSIIIKQNNELKIVARSDSTPEQLSSGNKLQLNLAFERNLPIAKLIDATDRKGRPAQAWYVVSPATDEKGDVLAVVSSSLLTTDAQEAISSAYRTSFYVLIASIIVIFGLLFRHFRLIGYVQLLAKQRELNQTMGDFLSVATHELKAPTSIIKGYLSNVMDGLHGPINDDVRAQLQTSFAQTDRLNSLVQDLLNVSRIEQGRIEYTYSAVDSVKLLSIITQNYKVLAKEKGLDIIYQPAQNIPLIHADEGRLQEIFTNLIDNGVKYTATGSVTVTQIATKDSVITSIKDTGFGIGLEEKKRLFQRFYRIKNEQTEKISGTGLGLWIIKQYITSMGGTIEVESMQGAGSNFIVSMKIAQNDQKV